MPRSIASSSLTRRARAMGSSSRSSASTLPGRVRVRCRSTRREPTIGSTRALNLRIRSVRFFGALAFSKSATSSGSESRRRLPRFRSARRRTKQPPSAPGTMVTPASEYAIVGLIRKAQGIRGEVVVEPLTDKPDVIFASGSRVFAGTRSGDLAPARDVRGVEEVPTLTISSSKPFKKGLIVQFEELQDRDSADLWRGRYLLAPFAELPPLEQDEVYLHDLIGMRVVSTTGEQLGTVTTFYELPQGLVLDIQTARATVMVPYRPEIVVRTDIEQRTIVIDEKLGLMDDLTAGGERERGRGKREAGSEP